MNISIKVDTSQLDKMLADFPATLAVAQKSALLSIGAEIKSQAERAFRHPNYRPSPWAPRKEEYQRVVNKRTGKAKFKRKDTWPLLIKSGKLRQSIAFKLEGSDAVVVGSDAKYAPVRDEAHAGASVLSAGQERGPDAAREAKDRTDRGEDHGRGVPVDARSVA